MVDPKLTRTTDAQGNRRDLTKVEGNPAADLAHLYDSLMAITDADQLHAKLVDLVEYRLQNGGISKTNAAKFRREAGKALAEGLVRLQFYATNWMMRAGGLGVIYSGSR